MGRIMGVDDVTLANGSTDIAVASTAVIYTKAMRITPAEFFGLSYKFTSATGNPDVKIEIQQSFALPTTEGSADNNWVEPETTPDVESSLTTETMHHKAINPVPLPFIRFKITGNAANPADTTGTMKFTRQEE